MLCRAKLMVDITRSAGLVHERHGLVQVQFLCHTHAGTHGQQQTVQTAGSVHSTVANEHRLYRVKHTYSLSNREINGHGGDGGT